MPDEQLDVNVEGEQNAVSSSRLTGPDVFCLLGVTGSSPQGDKDVLDEYHENVYIV